jgi:hypothetical protein
MAPRLSGLSQGKRPLHGMYPTKWLSILVEMVDRYQAIPK